MMIPILVLFVITIYILIEKILIINRESKSPKGFTDEIISKGYHESRRHPRHPFAAKLFPRLVRGHDEGCLRRSRR